MGADLLRVCAFFVLKSGEVVLKKYWLEILVFGFVATILMVDLNPDYTMVCKSADSLAYLYAAKYLQLFHASPPLYILVSHLFLQLPFGTEAWRMGLVSVFSTLGACIFIYLIVKDFTKQRLYALFSVLVYGTSALVLSQTIIIESYPLLCVLAVASYYFYTKKRWKLLGLMIGLGLCVHVLMGFVLVVYLFYKEFRTNWKALLVMVSCLSLYLYIPLVRYFSGETLVAGNFIGDIFNTAEMLIGTLSIWDVPKRLLDILSVVGVSIGVVCAIPLVYYFKGSKFWKQPLFWLIVLPIVVFFGELDTNTYDYMMLSFPFLAVAIGCGLYKIVCDKKVWAKVVAYASVFAVLGFGIFNINYFDIGRTLDKDMTTKEFYEVDLAKIPDKSIFISTGQAEILYKFNRDYNKNIYPITIGILGNDIYMAQLKSDGIEYSLEASEFDSDANIKIARSIIELNDNVWIAKPNGKLFGYEVLNANHNSALLNGVDVERLQSIKNNPQVQWNPYNPYDILTNKVIDDWNYVLRSNWNVRMFGGLALVGILVSWYMGRNKSNEEELEKVK